MPILGITHKREAPIPVPINGQTFARHSPDIRQETAREPKTSLFRQETADDPNPFRIMLFSTV